MMEKIIVKWNGLPSFVGHTKTLKTPNVLKKFLAIVIDIMVIYNDII